uniref:Uncharacterized protein n=1 Tax=Mus spicilegus TaxID=10103 RepID=A0A8C6GAU6_MUSSI
MPAQATDPAKVPSAMPRRKSVRVLRDPWAQQDMRVEQLSIFWRNVVPMSLLHLGTVYSPVLVPRPRCSLCSYFCFLLTALCVTAGGHHLWSHRSYKAKLPLRIFLTAANSMAFHVILTRMPSLSILEFTFSKTM